jgi:hypothetical protein
MGLGVAVLVAGCSGSDDDDDAGNNPGGSTLTPSQLCGNVALDTCTKIYSCTTEAQRRTLGFQGDSSQCLGNALQQLGCASSTAAKVCAGAQGSMAADATNCSNQVKAASCADVAAKPVTAYASGCGQCAVHP